MTVVRAEGRFASSDGLALYEQWWLPEGEARGVVAIVHGYAEHSGRYTKAAEFLANRGYAVESLDLRGHGRSEGTRARVSSANEYLLDLRRFLERVRERRPGKPLFLLGHSMGGLVAALFVVTRDPALAGLILSGPAISVDGTPPPARLAVAALARLAPGAGLVRLDAQAISRDPEVVSAYVNDPLVYTGKIQAGLLAAMVRGIRRVDRDADLIQLPLLLLHGREDRLAPAAASEMLYARAVSPDKTLKIYEGLRHEIFNEPERLQVLGDLVTWLDAHTAGGVA